MSKWKLEIKAPFGGYCFDWYKDNNNIYGSSNESTSMSNVDMGALSFLRQWYAQRSLENISQIDTFFHGNTTGEPVVSTSGKLLYLADFDTTSEEFSDLSGLPLSLSTSSFYRANIPRFNTVNIWEYYYTFYSLSNGNGEIAKSGGYDGTPSIDVDWGSTVPTGHAALQPHYDNGYCVSKYDAWYVFGNSNYLWKLSNSLTLTPQYISFGSRDYVYDIETLNGYIYVLTCNNFNIDNVTKSTIYYYKSDMLSNEYSDFAVISARISTIIVFNNRLYAFYKYTNSSDNWFWVLNGNQLQDIKKFDGDLPNPWQVDVYENGLLWHNGSKIYHAFKRPAWNWVIEQPFSPKYTTINGIMSYRNKIIVGSTNGTLFDVSVYSTRTVSSNWYSLTQLLSDNNINGFIDSIEVTTNKLVSGARCDLGVYTNQWTSAAYTATINTVGNTKHIFRNLWISNINEFYIKLDWTNGSTSNLCDIRKVTIYGHWNSR